MSRNQLKSGILYSHVFVLGGFRGEMSINGALIAYWLVHPQRIVQGGSIKIEVSDMTIKNAIIVGMLAMVTAGCGRNYNYSGLHGQITEEQQQESAQQKLEAELSALAGTKVYFNDLQLNLGQMQVAHKLFKRIANSLVIADKHLAGIQIGSGTHSLLSGGKQVFIGIQSNTTADGILNFFENLGPALQSKLDAEAQQNEMEKELSALAGTKVYFNDLQLNLGQMQVAHKLFKRIANSLVIADKHLAGIQIGSGSHSLLSGGKQVFIGIQSNTTADGILNFFENLGPALQSKLDAEAQQNEMEKELSALAGTKVYFNDLQLSLNRMKSASEKFKLILKSDVIKTKHVPIQICEGSSNELNSGTAMIGIDSSAEAVLTFFESL